MPEAMLVALPLDPHEWIRLGEATPLPLTDEERLVLALMEKAGDHFYGAWKGGSASSGGGPMSPEDQKAALIKRNPAAYSTEDTEARYCKDGKWDDQRAADVHEPIIGGWLDEVPPADGPPTLYMTGGGMGGGKTTVLESKVAGMPGYPRAAVIDPDKAKWDKDTKRGIPEYKAGIGRKDPMAASAVHEESSHIAKTAVARGLAQGKDVVYDTSGDSGPKKLGGKIAKFRAIGGPGTKVFGEYAFPGSVQEAVRRADDRAKKTGRYVPHTLLRQNHAGVAQSWFGAAGNGTFDRLRLWSTAGAYGTQPTLIASAVGGKITVHDRKQFDVKIPSDVEYL
jgi:hypothetical protein